MAFLNPFFLVGLAAITIPVLVHLVQREKKRVIEFPSLMFVRRIPYQSVRRRRIRHWFLLLMRAAAIALIVASRLQRRRTEAAWCGKRIKGSLSIGASAAPPTRRARHGAMIIATGSREP